ncbi:MAG: PA14 domain-containing protein [Chryseolinea sp.]
MLHFRYLNGSNIFPFLVMIFWLVLPASQAQAQCIPAGNQTSYGADSWIGYVYDGANSFATYLGSLTQTQNFDQSFCGGNCDFPIDANCTVNTESFSIRYRMALTVTTCGTYPITLGGDDGVRLSIDGGATWEMTSLYNDHAYAEVTQNIYFMATTYNLVIEYYENATMNRVRFNMGARNGDRTGGVIGVSQTLCQSSIDPAIFNSEIAAQNCTGDTPGYQWQISSDNVTYSDITSATSGTYDAASQPAGIRYYRRQASLAGGPDVYSNVVSVSAESTQGDQTTYGTNTWIGYVYDGVNNFSANYRGYFTIGATTFDESFCGADCNFALNGCGVQTQTFSARFKMKFTPPISEGYTFTIGADDGVRLSVNGGSSYVLNDYSDHGYREVTSGVVNLLAGNTYDLVLDYYEAGGDNRVRFTYATGPLPVTWSFLDGYHDAGVNVLDWKTASEKNNNGFRVERSMDGMTFDSLGFVDGYGTSQVARAYTFVDGAPAWGWNYYRLKQIDYDGKYEYSKVIPVFSDAVVKVGVYPNPAGSSVYISHGGAALTGHVTLRHMLTSKMYYLKPDKLQPARYLLENIMAGIYIISFTVDGQPYSEKLIVF